jgi:hypothetical protein
LFDQPQRRDGGLARHPVVQRAAPRLVCREHSPAPAGRRPPGGREPPEAGPRVSRGLVCRGTARGHRRPGSWG